MAYTSRQAQLVTAAYQKYLHRSPSSGEIQNEVDEAARRGENESQWQARVDAHYAPRPQPAPAPAPTPAAPDPDFSTFTTFKGGPPDSYTGEFTGTEPTLEQVNRNDKIRGDSLSKAKVIPGATPTLGVLPSGTIVDLRSGLPAKDVSPVDQAYAKIAVRNPAVPKYYDVKDKIELSGRGYEYKGDPSPEERALEARFLAGDASAAGPLANLRMKRLQVPERSGLENIMRPLTLTAVLAGLSALTGAAAGPALGGLGAGVLAGGVGSAGGQALTNQEFDWRKVLTSMAAGGAGSIAGAATSGLGNLGSGAAAGAASAGTNVALTAAMGGHANPWDIATSALSSGLAKSLTGLGMDLGTKTGSDPGGIGNFEIRPEGIEAALIKMFGGLGAKGSADMLRSLLPAGEPTGFATEMPTQGSPFLPKEVMDKLQAASMAARKAEQQAALQDAMREYESKRAEFEARRAEAMAAAQGRYDEQFAEYNQKVADYKARAEAAAAARGAALERLRTQALSYMEQANTARSTPLPPIQVAQGPAPLPPPDPFAPSAALEQQPFGGDFPVSQGAEMLSDFPISAEAVPGGAPPLAKKPSLQQLPLNIQQIQAALAARRR